MGSVSRTPDANWSLPYNPRPYMVDFHQRTQRYAYMVLHRRAGKSVASVAELVIRALYTKKKNAQFFYVAPFRHQAKAIAWQYLVDMVDGIATEVKVSELSVTLPTGAKIFLFGSDNPDAMRGLYADGVILDEFADCRPNLLQAVVMPLLIDRKGWLVLLGTPKGRLNQFYEYYEIAQKSTDWFHKDMKVTDTKIIPTEETDRLRASVSESKWNQEFMNDFSAELLGTYYSTIINNLEARGQINQTVTHDPSMHTHVAFDIGRGDSTVAWFWQQRPDGLAIIDCYANNGEPAQHYIDHLKALPYDLGNVWLPHDARALTFATDKSALEQFLAAFDKSSTSVHITPKLSVEDGIEATRQTLPLCHFNGKTCWTGVEALRVYRKKWDELHQCYSDKPLHDFASDFADSFRYLSIVANVKKPRPNDPLSRVDTSLVGLATYNLDKLYKDREKNQPRRIQKLRI